MTTVTLHRYAGLANRFHAFAQMGLAPGRLTDVPGMRFSRLMGSGGGNGFGLSPNWGVYAMLSVWEDEAAARSFYATHPWWRQTLARQSETATFYLAATMSHGAWSGGNPFSPQPELYRPAEPVAVLTRATIRTRKLADFWRYVPATSASVHEQPDRLLSVGVGEYPVFMQATFSLWRSGKAMQDFAYKSRHHEEVVRLTRERDWYKEEMFTRFRLLSVEGRWNGRPAAQLLE